MDQKDAHKVQAKQKDKAKSLIRLVDAFQPIASSIIKLCVARTEIL